MIGVVDIGRGNLLSVCKALEWLGAEVELCAEPGDLERAERVVLPGVGAFSDGMARLTSRGFVPALDVVRRSGRPVLGLCLGLQLLADRSFEGGETAGLGWIPGDVRRIPTKLRVPHVGWNTVTSKSDHPLFAGVPDGADFYFVHSYQLQCDSGDDVLATCDYDGPVVAAVRHGPNVAATQFHPEKSQENGLALLANFLRWQP